MIQTPHGQMEAVGPSVEAVRAAYKFSNLQDFLDICYQGADVLKLKELIAAGTLGRIEAIRDTMRDPSPAPRAYLETSGGLYRDMTIHNFDCVRWMMSQEVKELYAMGSALISPSSHTNPRQV